MDDNLKYPIGRFVKPDSISAEERARLLERVRTTPARLAEVAGKLGAKKLDTAYRPGGWTARQVLHHVPDSHMQAYSRTKMALTESAPLIKPYEEGEWAKLPDTFEVPVEVSLSLLDGIHKRWLAVLDRLTEEQWKRTYVHPQMGAVSLETMLALYAWHGDHHLGHVKIVAEAV